jgi:hypothetical protein
MRNSEARQILIDHNAWRHSNKADYLHSASAVNLAIDTAIAALGESKKLDLEMYCAEFCRGYDAGKRSKSSIAQAIRDAAVNGAKSGIVENNMCYAFLETKEEWMFALLSSRNTKARTFMLLVAEALES